MQTPPASLFEPLPSGSSSVEAKKSPSRRGTHKSKRSAASLVFGSILFLLLGMMLRHVQAFSLVSRRVSRTASASCSRPFLLLASRSNPHRAITAPSKRPWTALYSSSSSSSTLSSDQDASAASKSRPAFRMPQSSPDDSSTSSSSASWESLGLWPQVVDALQQANPEWQSPTPVQSMMIPRLLFHNSPQESVAFLAATGSGKTLAYLIPLLQGLKQQEWEGGYERSFQRPRVLVLAPTRELVNQIAAVAKQLSHSLKVSVHSLVGGGGSGGNSAKQLKGRYMDVLVATPGQLLKQWQTNQNIFLGHVDTIVLDEMDTLLEQGFQSELRQVLYPLLYKEGAARAKKTAHTHQESIQSLGGLKSNAPRILLTSATMTQAIQKLLGQNPKTAALQVSAKRHFTKNEPQGTSSSPTTAGGPQPTLVLPPMPIVSAPGWHKAVPRLEQVFVQVGNTDKMSLLLDVVGSRTSSKKKAGSTMVFCNTAASVRAVQHALAEAQIVPQTFCYHGEMNSAARTQALEDFRRTAQQQDPEQAGILVATDLAARGLDIPQVDHVVMFDFPLNALDYLHRAGRTARGTRAGLVTALVAKRDFVLATAIEHAVQKGLPLDGLSARKSDYLPGSKKTNTKPKKRIYVKSNKPAASGKPARGGSRSNNTSNRRSRR